MDPQTPPPPPLPGSTPWDQGQGQGQPQWTPAQTPVPTPVPTPWTQMPMQPPPRPSGRSRLVSFIVIGVIAALVIVGVAYFLGRKGVNDLAVGDCFNSPAQQDSVSDVEHQACTSPHDAEVFLLLTDPAAKGALYPGEDHFLNMAVDSCLPAANSYLGSDFQASEFDAGYFYPTSDSWSSNDRGVTCYLYRIDKAKLTKPLKGSGGSS